MATVARGCGVDDAETTTKEYDQAMKKGLSETAASYEGLIRKAAGVCGGKARVRKTRIPFGTLVGLKRLGVGEAQLLDDHPGPPRNFLQKTKKSATIQNIS